MLKVLLLISGGAAGTLARYYLSQWINRLADHPFPFGILSVNVLGSFLIGLAGGIFNSVFISSHARLFLFTGFFGGFTTFSTFAFDTLTHVKTGDYKLAVLNVLASNVLGLIAVFAGYYVGKQCVVLFK